MGRIASAFGYRWFKKLPRGWEARFAWAQFCGGAGFALGLSLFEDHYSLHIHLGWPNCFIRLPILQRWHREPHEIMESWGFSVPPDTWASIHFNWGRHTKIVHMPWEWTWHRTSYLKADGTWLTENSNHALTFSERREERDRVTWEEKYPYRYLLKSGEVQKRTATVRVEEREWRMRWLRWLPLIHKTRKSIDVSFDDEVGERTGSWKGGCIGCGYTILPGETPLDTLRRMEAERDF